MRRWREGDAKRFKRWRVGRDASTIVRGREGREGKIVRWRRRELFRLKRWRELWREEEDFHF